jgi:ribokinase
MLEVIGFGALNVDRIYRVQCLVVDGEAPVEEQALFPGGSAANTIYGLAKLGVEAGFVGAVGDDDEGRLLLHDFEGVGVDTSHIKVKRGAATGAALCLTDNQGKRALYISPGANSLLTEQDINVGYLNQAKIIHLSSFVAEEQLNLQNQVLSAISPSVMVSSAPGEIYARKGLYALASMIKRAHILFINQRELKQLVGEGVKMGAKRCLEQGCHIVAVTREKGATCYLSDGERRYTVSLQRGSRQPVVDTTGAGDAFAAGFLYGLLREKSLQQCGFLGSIMAQFAIAKMGARTGLPSLSQLQQKHIELLGHPL